MGSQRVWHNWSDLAQHRKEEGKEGLSLENLTGIWQGRKENRGWSLEPEFYNWTNLCLNLNFFSYKLVRQDLCNLVGQSVSTVAQSCPTFCDPMDCSMPGLPVHHQLQFTQTHVHWVGDAIQPSHPLHTPSPPALNLSQCQGLSQGDGFSH